MPKKKPAKKEDLDINIKVNNLEKAIRYGIKKHKKEKWKSCGGGGFWVFGSALAITLSYTQSSSILWAIIHGILSWFYVIYRIILLYI
jgi:hypothetical protein|tara:strand:+ start:4533 stop:4796 length:264 start_codon:yes stop_codon:yes gene_type:complete